MKIVSWNVNGIRAVHRKGEFIPFVQKLAPDIICLQETKAEQGQAVIDLPEYTEYWSSAKKKGYSGTAIFTKVKPLSAIYGMDIKEFDQEGRLVGAEYDDFWLLNAYFPNGGRGPERLDYKMRFYDAFLTFAEKLRKQKPVIFTGDINTAHEEIDLAKPEENKDGTGFLPSERAWIDEVISAGYVDSFRHFHPHTKDAYTYWDMRTHARDRNEGWRIDSFFIASEFIKQVKKAEIHPDIYGSDHCPVSITLS